MLGRSLGIPGRLRLGRSRGPVDRGRAELQSAEDRVRPRRAGPGQAALARPERRRFVLRVGRLRALRRARSVAVHRSGRARPARGDPVMQFQSLKLGDPSLFFASTNTARLPFQFPTPIQGAYAILQRASFERTPERGSYYAPDPDLELAVLEVSVLALFVGLQSKTSGEVQIH